MLSRIVRRAEPSQFFAVRGLRTERGQAIARLCWTAILAVYLIVTFPKFRDYAQYPLAWMMLLVQATFASVVAYLVSKKIAEGPRRVAYAVVFDQACLSATLFLTGEITAPFIMVTLLLTFGSGLRYGRRYAVLSSTIGSVSMGLLVINSPYWIQHSDLALGLAAAIIFIPLYVFRLTDGLAVSMRTDGMTKLWNRVAFDEQLDILCNDTSRASTCAAVVVLDLDGFKTINDKQGHPRGDKVLQEAAYALSVELCPFGTVARIGGDEFGVIANELKSTGAFEAALDRFLARAREVGDYFESPLSASIGVYYFETRTSPAPKFLYKAADSLMYQSKTLGKSQIQTSSGKAFSKEGQVVIDSASSAVSA